MNLDPVTQCDSDAIAAQLKNSKSYADRLRFATAARKRGHLLPVEFSDEVAIVRQEAGDVVAFSASGEGTPPMTRDRARLLGLTGAGQAMLAMMGLKPDPTPIEGEETVTRNDLDRLLSHTQAGRDVLKRRGHDPMAIERLQRLG